MTGSSDAARRTLLKISPSDRADVTMVAVATPGVDQHIGDVMVIGFTKADGGQQAVVLNRASVAKLVAMVINAACMADTAGTRGVNGSADGEDVDWGTAIAAGLVYLGVTQKASALVEAATVASEMIDGLGHGGEG